ncbi:hypothetical protein NUU61_007894 [Penicillium alfredii]|uniref:Rhodopsin domain-containing protein n=1 Tax=Penicillium alfredii TaxID=1506179 RepID=A0A9W9ERC5_9EURO|nr:uncharacterized protein NUU61_007894 [Penicillium alfredii]KAJ5086587.1 hypothetical protein NUU61_007894 [Penicillium alfredii]
MAKGMSVAILVVSWAETFVGLTFLTLRFVSNWKFVGRFRWDFAIASLTVLTESTAQIFLQLSVNAGMGQHIAVLSDTQRVAALHWGWVFQLLAIGASMLGKLAILAFLMQVRGRHASKPWLLIILGVLIFAVNITVMGTILGQCSPMEKLWDDSLPGTCDPGRLMNQNYSFFQASFNTFADAALATYPVHLFWKLQMKLRIKIALSILMGLGWIAAVCSAVKCYELKALTETTDITYAQASLLIWASTEAWIVIVVGCVPPIRPLMERVLQHLGLTSKKTSTPYNLQSPNAYVAYGTNRSNGASHSHYQSSAFGGRKPFSRDEEDVDWMELTDARGSSASKEQIIGGKDVMVTTDIVTQFEERRNHRAGSSGGSQTSGDEAARETTDTQKVV